MPMAASDTVTELLARWDEGPVVHARVMPIVYREVRTIAGKLFSGEQNPSIEPTELVHEGYLRICQGGPWEGRGHFFGSIAIAMSRVLIDRARRRNSQKRGGHLQRVELDGLEVELADGLAEACYGHPGILAVDKVLKQLEAENPRWASIVLLRFFAGLSVEETAETMGISKSTARTEWTKLRHWLRAHLKPEDGVA
jgi:RNA polymerase sigma factor (TIGR02999 family)